MGEKCEAIWERYFKDLRRVNIDIGLGQWTFAKSLAAEDARLGSL